MQEKEFYIQFNDLNKYNNIIHFFTKKPYNFNKNIIHEKTIINNYKELMNYNNVKKYTIKESIQTHTNIVKTVTKNNINEEFKDVDGLITNLKNVALVTKVADCQGILLYDTKQNVIGNIHSGWRGTLNKIIKNAIELMIKEYNSCTEDIKVYICPSILKCCFEVGEDVKNMFEHNFKNINSKKYITKGSIINNEQKYYIDTIYINKIILKDLGIKEENIYLSNICTKCNKDKYYSHRGEINSGRNIALIMLK